MMNPEVKKMWIDALRSGNYKQGRHHLRKGDKFCCLGVLCDIYSRQTGFGNWGEEQANVFSFLGERSMPHRSVQNWAFGLNENEPGHDFSVSIGFKKSNLAHVNDVLEKSFSEIADIIEEQL